MTDPRLNVAASALMAALPEVDALDLIRSMEIGIHRRRKQSLNASARSALTGEEKAAVRQRYREGSGRKYGLIKRLARDFNVSCETIRKTVRCASSEADSGITQAESTSADYSHSQRANDSETRCTTAITSVSQTS